MSRTIKDHLFFPCGHPRIAENIQDQKPGRPSGSCRTCMSSRKKESWKLPATKERSYAWKKAHPEQIRISSFKCHHNGVTPDTKEQMLVAQRGKCLACGTND